MSSTKRTECGMAEGEACGFAPLPPEQASRVIGGGRIRIPIGYTPEGEIIWDWIDVPD
ncbi:MAG: hypothetical protein JWM27_2274 [Gemmatimonadetes bacterium]|nr:hypothetical protein [Gemmatimonadota bacterium]